MPKVLCEFMRLRIQLYYSIWERTRRPMILFVKKYHLFICSFILSWEIVKKTGISVTSYRNNSEVLR